MVDDIYIYTHIISMVWDSNKNRIFFWKLRVTTKFETPKLSLAKLGAILGSWS